MSNDYFDDTYTPGFTDPIDSRPSIDFLKNAHVQLRETMKEAYEPNKLKTQTEFEAICLMQLNNTKTLDMPFVRIKARVPELHTLLPIPASETDYRAISLYPTFTCRNNDFDIKVVNGSVLPGTRMRVSYENMGSFAGPKILGISVIQELDPTAQTAFGQQLAERRANLDSSGTDTGTRRVEVDGWCVPRTPPGGAGTVLKKGGSKPSGMRCADKPAKLLNSVADDFEKARQEVNSRGGIITSAGGYRPLSAILHSARSGTSWHYTARALDMATYSGMGTGTGDVRLDPHVVVRDPAHPKSWIVWAKVMDTTAVNAASVPTVTLNAFSRGFKATGSPQIIPVTGKYFNLTDIFKKYNFERIPGRSPFWTSKNDGSGGYLNSEWWHFQNITAGGGIPIGTTWGEVLLQQYTLEHIEASNYNKLTKTQDPIDGVHTGFRYDEVETPWQHYKDKKYEGGNLWA
jgi:hypothetical protein